MIKVLVLGSRGMLGHTLADVLEQKDFVVIRHTRTMYNPLVDSLENLAKLWQEKPDYIINCIAQTQHNSEHEQDIWKINAFFPRQLAIFCRKYAIKLIHISTNGVFSGKKGNYTENDIPDATDAYGMSKFLGEDATNAMLIRTSIIGHEKNNKPYLLEWVRSQTGKQISGYTNHFWNGLTTLELSQQLAMLMQENAFACGIFHWFSSEKVSKAQLIALINEVYGLSIRLNCVEAAQADDKTLGSVNKIRQFKALFEQLRLLHLKTKNYASAI